MNVRSHEPVLDQALGVRDPRGRGEPERLGARGVGDGYDQVRLRPGSRARAAGRCGSGRRRPARPSTTESGREKYTHSNMQCARSPEFGMRRGVASWPLSSDDDLARSEVAEGLSSHQLDRDRFARDGDAPLHRAEDERADPEGVAERRRPCDADEHARQRSRRPAPCTPDGSRPRSRGCGRYSSAIIWAIVSVSAFPSSSTPWAWSRWRTRSKLTMSPLWAIAASSSRSLTTIGWAFSRSLVPGGGVADVPDADRTRAGSRAAPG